MSLVVTVLVTWMALSPLEVHIADERLDEAAVRSSLKARVGAADDWVISVAVVPQSAVDHGEGEAPPAGTAECSDAGRGYGDANRRCTTRAVPRFVVDVTVRRPDGSSLTRQFLLQSSDRAGRSRELSSLLAVFVEEEIVETRGSATAAGRPTGEAQSATSEQVAPTKIDGGPSRTAGGVADETGRPSARRRSWPSARELESRAHGPIRSVTASARFGYGGAKLRGGPVSDGGVGLAAGGRLLNDRLLVRGEVGWSRSSRGDLVFDGARVGMGLGVGAGLWRRRLWLGGEVAPNLLVVRIDDVTSGTLVSSSLELGGHAQLGVGRFALHLRSGLDAVLPTLVGVGRAEVISWGGARFFGAISVGARF